MRKPTAKTKFSDLCEVANKAFVEIHTLEQECMEFGAGFIQGLMAYLECPNEKARHYNLQGEEPVGPLSLEKSTFREDGWWHTGMMMDLRPTVPGAMVAGNMIRFNLVFKRGKDSYLVRFGRDTKEHTVHPDRREDFTAAYDYFIQMVKTHFEEEPQRFLDPRHRRRMGFL